MKNLRHHFANAALVLAACSFVAIAPASAQATRTTTFGQIVNSQQSSSSAGVALQGRGSRVRDVAVSQSTIAAPLTRAECERLGGTVKRDRANFCSRATHYCTRVDQNGTPRAVCINES